MPENLNPEHQLEYLKELRKKYEAVLADAQKSGDYSEPEKLKDELNERLTALEAQFPKPEPKENNIENEEFDELGFEQRTISVIEKFSEEGFISSEDVLINLIGMGSEPALILREYAYGMLVANNNSTLGNDPNSLMLKSLAGVDNEAAWRYRDNHMNNHDALCQSLAGLDSDKAWDIRDTLLVNSIMLQSLIGLNSERAWDMREAFFSKINASESNNFAILQSLAGLDSDRAWKIRDAANLKSIDIRPLHGLILSLTGLDSERAWATRSKLEELAKIGSRDSTSRLIHIYLARSLAGLDSLKAWDLRSKLTDRDLNFSLAGLDNDRAWQIRKRLEIEASDDILSKADLIENLNGASTTAIGWRTARKYNKQKED